MAFSKGFCVVELYIFISQNRVFKLIDGGINSHEGLQMCCILCFSNETDLTLAVAKMHLYFTTRLHDVLVLPNFIESLPKYERYMIK